MPRGKKVIEQLDHAFELILVLVTVILATMSQFASLEPEANLPPIIANLRRVSVVFIFPIIAAILVWVLMYFTDDENRKMHFRTYAWGSLIFTTILEIMELYIICIPENAPVWVVYPVMIPLLSSLFGPIFPLWLLHRILNRYQTAFRQARQTVDFFSDIQKMHRIRKYVTFILAWIVFWTCFGLTIII